MSCAIASYATKAATNVSTRPQLLTAEVKLNMKETENLEELIEVDVFKGILNQVLWKE